VGYASVKKSSDTFSGYIKQKREHATKLKKGITHSDGQAVTTPTPNAVQATAAEDGTASWLVVLLVLAGLLIGLMLLCFAYVDVIFGHLKEQKKRIKELENGFTRWRGRVDQV